MMAAQAAIGCSEWLSLYHKASHCVKQDGYPCAIDPLPVTVYNTHPLPMIRCPYCIGFDEPGIARIALDARRRASTTPEQIPSESL